MQKLLMKRLANDNRGFSMVELMVGLLIMAVIAGIAITLVGGVLDTSKGRADKETAELIRKAVQDYMSASNDSNLTTLIGSSATATTGGLVAILSTQVTVSGTSITYKALKSDNTLDTALSVPGTPAKDNQDLDGTFGPFLDPTKTLTPKQSVNLSWNIDVNSSINTVTVSPSTNAAASNYVKVHS